jgi:hypothetical protein
MSGRMQEAMEMEKKQPVDKDGVPLNIRVAIPVACSGVEMAPGQAQAAAQADIGCGMG